MTPTGDERRVVAARLRMCGQTVKGTKHFFMYLANCVDTPSEDLDADDTFCLQRNRRVAERTLEKLADLIDPTCLAVHQGTSMDDELVCSRCGASLGAEVGGRQMFVPNFCSCCGARVVSRDEQ